MADNINFGSIFGRVSIEDLEESKLLQRQMLHETDLIDDTIAFVKDVDFDGVKSNFSTACNKVCVRVLV